MTKRKDEPQVLVHGEPITGLLGNGKLTLAARFSSLAGGAAFLLVAVAGGAGYQLAPRAWDFVVKYWEADIAFKASVTETLTSIKTDMAAGVERGNALRARDSEFSGRLQRIEDRMDRLTERGR